MLLFIVGLTILSAAGTREAVHAWPHLWTGLSGSGQQASLPNGGEAAASQASGAASAISRGGASASDQVTGNAGAPQQTAAKPAVVHAIARLDKPTVKPAVYKAKPGSKLVALTFDDGPDNRYTPQILDILKKANVHATFFTVGTQVKKYPAIMKRIIQEGNEIGNHSYHHPDLSKLPDTKIVNELMWTDTLIKRSAGIVPDLVRAPYGAVSPSLKAIAMENGRTLVGWTVDTRDWAGDSVPAMRLNVDRNTHPGGIILMHCFGGKHIKNTPVLLPLIIKDLQSKGYTFVTVDQLLAAKAKGSAQA